MRPTSVHSRFRSIGPALLMVVAASVAGCGGGSSKSTGTGSSENGTGHSAGTTIADRRNCNELLETAIATLQPDQYLVGDDSGAVTVLSGWRTNCETAELRRVQAGMVGEATRRMLDDDTLARVEAATFSERDAAQLRTSLLFHDVAIAAGGDAANDLERAVNTFEFVTRHLQLLSEDDPLAGLDPFRTLLFGEGSARDRAWILAALLRQQRIDTVILRPAGTTDDAAADGEQPSANDATESVAESTRTDERWLVGVVLGGRCYLFDPRLGLAIPSPEDDGTASLPGPPATLDDVRGESNLLGALDLPGHSYPLDDADLDDVRVEVVGSSSLWAPRMAGLQRILHGRRATVLVDSLDDPEGLLDVNRGIVHRLTSAIDDWSPDRIGVWPYPEQRTQITLGDLSADQRSAVLSRGEVFSVAAGAGSRSLLQGRLQQLRGVHTSSADESNAASSFTNVRGTASSSGEAERNAIFWTAASLRESGDRHRGDGLLREYLRRFPNGRFARTAHLLRALQRAESAPARAVEELDAIAPDAPDAHGLALLRRRWSTKAEPVTPPAEPQPETPAEVDDAPVE